MSVHQSSAGAAVHPIAALEATARSVQNPPQPVALERAANDNTDRASTIGLPGMIAVSSGIIVAIGGTAWAIQSDVPYPLAIMAGYCSLAASACLYIALTLVKKRPPKVQQAVKISRAPNYAAWKVVSKYSVSDASRLWCDIEPGCPASQESIAWAHAMLDAIKSGELRIIPRAGTPEAMRGQEQTSPTWHTEVAREVLTSWAQSHGHSPRFLQT